MPISVQSFSGVDELKASLYSLPEGLRKRLLEDIRFVLSEMAEEQDDCLMGIAS